MLGLPPCREVRFRIIIEMRISFTVRHAARLAAYGAERPLKECDISEVVINVCGYSP